MVSIALMVVLVSVVSVMTVMMSTVVVVIVVTMFLHVLSLMLPHLVAPLCLLESHLLLVNSVPLIELSKPLGVANFPLVLFGGLFLGVPLKLNHLYSLLCLPRLSLQLSNAPFSLLGLTLQLGSFLLSLVHLQFGGSGTLIGLSGLLLCLMLHLFGLLGHVTHFVVQARIVLIVVLLVAVGRSKFLFVLFMDVFQMLLFGV